MYSTKQNQGLLSFNSILNENKPLPAHNELVIPFEFHQEKISKNKDLDNLDSTEPEFFKDFKILIDYKNSGNTRFNSLFNVQTREVHYQKVSRKNLIKNWS